MRDKESNIKAPTGEVGAGVRQVLAPVAPRVLVGRVVERAGAVLDTVVGSGISRHGLGDLIHPHEYVTVMGDLVEDIGGDGFGSVRVSAGREAEFSAELVHFIAGQREFPGAPEIGFHLAAVAWFDDPTETEGENQHAFV